MVAEAVRRGKGTAPLASPAARASGLLAAALVLIAVCLASIAYGSLKIPLGDVIDAFTSFRDVDEHVIVRDVRGPRTLVGLAVGAALGVAGAVMQGMTRNPLGDPGILGIEAGAAFAVVVAIFLLGVTSVAGYAWFALAGAAAAGTLCLRARRRRRGRGPRRSTWRSREPRWRRCSWRSPSAVLSFDVKTLNEYRFWIVGSVAGRDLDVLVVALPFLAAGFALALGVGARAQRARAGRGRGPLARPAREAERRSSPRPRSSCSPAGRWRSRGRSFRRA